MFVCVTVIVNAPRGGWRKEMISRERESRRSLSENVPNTDIVKVTK